MVIKHVGLNTITYPHPMLSEQGFSTGGSFVPAPRDIW